MADGVLQVVATLASGTGLPEDDVQNVFHIGTNGVQTLTGVDDAVIDFYNAIPTGDTVAIAEWLSAGLSRVANACQVDIYATNDLSGETPLGSPIQTQTFTLGASNNAAQLPEEVATVISVHGDLNAPVSQVNPTPPPAFIRKQSRRRGRTYVGPLAVTTGSVVGGLFRPAPAWRTRLCRAMDDLAVAQASIGTDQYLGVWSRRDEEVWELEGGWVDDAWDTQRRRGLAPTTRTLFTV